MTLLNIFDKLNYFLNRGLPVFELVGAFLMISMFTDLSYSQELNKPFQAQQKEIVLLTEQFDDFGYLRIVTNLDSFYIVVDNNYNNYRKVFKNDSLKLTIGMRNIIIIEKSIIDYDFDVEIISDTTIAFRITLGRTTNQEVLLRYSSYPRIKEGANLIILTDNDSDIFIDNKWIGHGFAKLDTIPQQYTLKTIHNTAGRTQKRIQLTANRLQIIKMYNKPRKLLSHFLTIIPGGKQYYTNHKSKSAIFFGLSITGLSLTYSYHQKFKNKNNAYLSLIDRYQRASSEIDAFQFGNESQSAFEAASTAAKKRNIFKYASIGIFTLNVIDTILNPVKSGYRKERGINVYAEYIPLNRHHAIGIGFSVLLN